MQAQDLPGWGEDTDLTQLEGLRYEGATRPVHIEMVDVYDCRGIVSNLVKAERYAKLYEQYGPWAMPPVVYRADNGWHIAGAHRMYGAWLAGLKQIPALIVGE